MSFRNVCWIMILVGLIGKGCCAPAHARPWGPSGCATPATVVAPRHVPAPSDTDIPPQFEWRKFSPTESHLYRNGVQVGGYDHKEKVFRKLYSDGTWGPKQYRTETCECGLDCKCKVCRCGESQPKQFFGVDSSKLHNDGVTRHYLSGERVPRQEALNALKLADDSTKPFVTFIGDDSKKTYTDFLSKPEATKCRVNVFKPSDWQVKDAGFVTSGNPTVYVQNAKGEVLYRKDTPTVDELLVQARKAQPDYDPSKDPSGGFDIPVLAYLKTHATAVVVVGLAGLVAFSLGKRS